MRMINETALSEAIRDYFIKKIDKDEYKVDTVDCHADIQAILRSQPTAYDSDKVVNQLKELKAQDYDDSDEAPEWEDIENVYEDGRSQGRYEAYYNAIEIVKSGGCNENL